MLTVDAVVIGAGPNGLVAANVLVDAGWEVVVLEVSAAGDGEAWLRLFAGWSRVRDPLLDALFRPLPAARPALRILRRLGAAGALDLARLAVLPVRRLADETFRGEGGGLLLTGNAMHADVPPDAAGSGVFGWLLTMLGQDVGFPVPVGGAGVLADALVARIRAGGGDVVTGARVDRVHVVDHRAVGVSTTGGQRVRARRAVLADVSAPALYRDLVGTGRLPPRLVRDLDRFQWDHPTFKVNWALDPPLPWRAAQARAAGTVHLGVDRRGFVDVAAALSKGERPARPFLVLGQMTTADPSRSPDGTESAWAYTHVPHDVAWGPEIVADQVRRMEETVERAAPGFRETVVGRFVQSPPDLEAADANLVGGAVNGGTSAIHQQLFFRPTRGLGRPETPVEGLFLASASAHPGGGVHGACGWNAARAALAAAGPRGVVRRALARSAWARLLRD